MTGPVFTLNLPLPPSVNRMKRSRITGRPLGNKSPNVQEWMEEADFDLWKQRPLPNITGKFAVFITWSIDDFGAFDWDNRVKPLMDYLQNRRVIKNDGNCIGGPVVFGEGVEPGRCQVELRELVECHSRTSSSRSSSRSTAVRRSRSSSSTETGAAVSTGSRRRSSRMSSPSKE